MQNIFYLQALIGEVINYSSKINSIYIEKNTILPLLSQYKITPIILTNIHVLYKLFPRNVPRPNFYRIQQSSNFQSTQSHNFIFS